MNKYRIWAMAVSIAAIALGVFPNLAKADGFPGGHIPRQPPHKPSCDSSDHCQPHRPQKPGSLYNQIYSKHRPYCGYLRRYRHRSRHWSEDYPRVSTLEDSSSKHLAFEWEPEPIKEDLMASTESYGYLSSSEVGSDRPYSQRTTMGGENALVLFIVIGLWFGLPSLFSPKDSKK